MLEQRCYLGRDDATLDGYQASQLTQAGTLGPMDSAWFDEALRSDVAYDKSVMAVCKELIDPDQVFEWVAAKAKEGNGASQSLMSNTASTMHDIEERLRRAWTCAMILSALCAPNSLHRGLARVIPLKR